MTFYCAAQPMGLQRYTPLFRNSYIYIDKVVSQTISCDKTGIEGYILITIIDSSSSHMMIFGSCSENNIQVFVRIRPPSPNELGISRVVDVDGSGTQIILKNDPSPRIFSYDHVADIDSTQVTNKSYHL